MEKLYDNTWVYSDQGVRIFLIAGNERALVVDTGMTGVDIHSLVRRCTDLPYKLLLTHADGDHTGGADQFEEFYMHPSEAYFYYNAQGKKGRMLPVFDGDIIDLGGRLLEVIHLPGHTPGSITVLDRDSRCLIGGDPIQEDGEIFMFGQHREMRAYIASLKRLDQRQDFDCIYPSHAVQKVDRSIIPQLIEGAVKILDGKLTGEEIEVFGHRVMSIDTGASRFYCDII